MSWGKIEKKMIKEIRSHQKEKYKLPKTHPNIEKKLDFVSKLTDDEWCEYKKCFKIFYFK